MNLFTINFKADKSVPLYKQLYDYIAGEIVSGSLKSGERLPSKKSLASHLSISMNTVDTGYSLLMQEGYIYSKPRSGYYVSEINGLIAASPQTTNHPVSIPHTKYRYDFRTNVVDDASFPYKTWAKLSRETLINGNNLLISGDTGGDYELRYTLAKYLHEFRGVKCSPGQVFIGAGVEYLLTMLCELMYPINSFALENPGYTKTSAVLKNSGGEISYIPMDSDGMIPRALEESAAQLCYLTPSHQFPTGIVMPIGRRYQLLNWASKYSGRYIIEDDYNSEFTFSGKPIPSMQGIDTAEKVIYISTFSRTLAPSIRIAYMVLPLHLSRQINSKFRGYSSTVSRFEQHTLMKFISGGYLGRHLNRVKTIYRKRRDFLIEKLNSYPINGGIEIKGGHNGLHILITFENEMAEKIMEKASLEKIRISRLSDYYFGMNEGQNTLIMGYAGMNEEDMADALNRLFDGLY